MKVECVVHLSYFIRTVIYSAVILVVLLPLQLCEIVENYSFFTKLYVAKSKLNYSLLKKATTRREFVGMFKNWNDILFHFRTFSSN